MGGRDRSHKNIGKGSEAAIESSLIDRKALQITNSCHCCLPRFGGKQCYLSKVGARRKLRHLYARPVVLKLGANGSTLVDHVEPVTSVTLLANDSSILECQVLEGISDREQFGFRELGKDWYFHQEVFH